jgi:hypothetical protein
MINHLFKSALDSFGEAYGTKCEKTRNWVIGDYLIQEYECIGFVGPHFYPMDLFKDGERIDSYGFKSDTCKVSFDPNKDLHLEFDLCNGKIRKFKPNKKNLDLNIIDSIIVFSNDEGKYKKLTTSKIEKFVKSWNFSEVRDFRNNKDSIFHPKFHYKFSVHSNNKTTEFLTFNHLINDKTNWIYLIDDDKKDFYKDIWNDY